MTTGNRPHEGDRYYGFGGEPSRYEGLGSADEYDDDDRWGDNRHASGDDAAAARRAQAAGGIHRGRGPAGYRRSDERIHEDVHQRLTDHPMLDASDIEVGVSDAEVTLDGTVPRREDKRLAEDIVAAVSGVSHVQNNLKWRRAAVDEPGGAGTGDATRYPEGAVGAGHMARE